MNDVSARQRDTAEMIGGLLAAGAMLAGLIALAYRPARIAPLTIVMALVAVGIGGRHSRLAAIALGVAATCWLVGMILAVVTGNPLF